MDLPYRFVTFATFTAIVIMFPTFASPVIVYETEEVVAANTVLSVLNNTNWNKNKIEKNNDNLCL